MFMLEMILLGKLFINKFFSDSFDLSIASCYRSTVEVFHNNNFLFKGLKKQESMYEGTGSLYMSKTYEWHRKEISTGDIIPNGMAHCFGPFYPALSQEDTRYFGSSLSNQIHTRKLYLHGPHGNIKTYVNSNNVNYNDDDLRAEITYTYDLTNHFTAMVDEIKVYNYSKIGRAHV